MGKELSLTAKDVNDYFSNIFDTKTSLGNYVNITLLTDNKQKKLYNLKKLDPISAFLGKTDVVITVNELIFDLLDDKQLDLLTEEILASISFDAEKDVIKNDPPDVSTYSGILTKYTLETWKETQEIVRATIDQLGLNEKPKKGKK
jgi:hypothetical protein